MLAVGEPVAVIVPPVVFPVTEELLQHKSTVLVMLGNGAVGGLNGDV